MESPKESTPPEKVLSPVRGEDIMEFFPVVQHDEDSDSPKEPFPSLSTEETVMEEVSALDSKYLYDSDLEKDREAGSASPVTRDQDAIGDSSPVMENSPVLESRYSTWKDNDSDRGSLPPSPGLEVATEDTPATYEQYSKDDTDHQDESLSPVASGEEGATGRRYSVPEFSDGSIPGTPREEEPARGNTYSVPSFSDDGSHSHNESFSPIAAREDKPSAGKAYSVPDFSDDGSHSGIASFSSTAGRKEEEGASAGKSSARLMTLSDEEIDLEVPERSFSLEPEPRTFSDEERDYTEELPSLGSKKKAARVGAYPNYSDDSDSERGSYRPREDSDIKGSPVAEKAPVVEETSPVIDTPSLRIDYSFDVESDVERVPPPAPRLRPIGTAKGDAALEKEISVPEKASPVTQKPGAKIPEKTTAKKKEWAVAKKASAKANAVVNSITKKLDHIRGNANRVRENIRKEIRILQSYQPTLDAAQSHRAAESAAMTSALFLITLYIVLLSIIYRLVATSYLPFLCRFVF